MDRAADKMKTFWDERARENAAWYVDTTVNYEAPDMDAFFAVGQKVITEALLEAPVQPLRRQLAVEIGPGLGRICAALADYFESVIGVDVSEEMVQQARTLVDNPRVAFQVGSGKDLGIIGSGTADFVTTFTVLQHLPSRDLVQGYLREAARILAPGGVVAAQWNNMPHPAMWRARAMWWRMRNRIGGPLRVGPRAERQFIGTRVAVEDVTGALAEAGLTVRGTKGLGSLFAWVWAEKPA